MKRYIEYSGSLSMSKVIWAFFCKVSYLTFILRAELTLYVKPGRKNNRNNWKSDSICKAELINSLYVFKALNL